MYELAINDTPVKIWAKSIDPHAWKEIMNLASLPFVFHHLAFMPDLHGGMGMPIGGILATKNVIIPNAVGVDIGCGMCAVKTSMKLSEIGTDVLKKKIMSGIRSRIPVGFDHHKDLQDEAFLPQGHDVDKLTVVKAQYIAARHQIGTLGGGNHFIELQKDGEDNLWIMLHSGSRNLGYKVAEYYNKIAREVNAQNYSVVQPELQLAFIPHKTPLFGAYWSEMKYCVDFAFCNRSLMMQRIQEVISDAVVLFEEDDRMGPLLGHVDTVLKASHDILHSGELLEPRQLAKYLHRFTHLFDILRGEGRLRYRVVRILIDIILVVHDLDGRVVPELFAPHHLDVQLHGAP